MSLQHKSWLVLLALCALAFALRRWPLPEYYAGMLAGGSYVYSVLTLLRLGREHRARMAPTPPVAKREVMRGERPSTQKPGKRDARPRLPPPPAFDYAAHKAKRRT